MIAFGFSVVSGAAGVSRTGSSSCRFGSLLSQRNVAIRRAVCAASRSVVRGGSVRMDAGGKKHEPEQKSVLQVISKHAKEVVQRSIMAAAVLATVMVLAGASPSEAASGGGRVGGSNFRSAPAAPRSAPAPQYSAPPPVVVAPTPYFSPFSPFGGGMFFSPMILPMGGGGGFFSLILFAAFAAFLVQSIQSRAVDAEIEDAFDPRVQLTTVKIGMLATAEELKRDLERMGRGADTSTSRGLHSVLQETVLALVRNPDYWVFGSSSGCRTDRMSSIEDAFESASMAERVKLREETLSNINSVQRSAVESTAGESGGIPSEYIVVSVIVAAAGDSLSEVPSQLNSAEDLRRALMALGSVSADSLQAVEIIWAPQGKGESLSRAEMLLDHPELRAL